MPGKSHRRCGSCSATCPIKPILESNIYVTCAVMKVFTNITSGKMSLTVVWCCKNTEIQHILRSTSCHLCNCVLYMSKAKFPTQYWLKRAPAPWFGTTPIRPRNHSSATVLGRHSTISLPLRGIHTAQVIYGT